MSQPPVNARLRSLRTLHTVSHRVASPTAGIEDREKFMRTQSAAEKATVAWYINKFGVDPVAGLHVARMTPAPETMAANFFSAAAIPMSVDTQTKFCILSHNFLKSNFALPLYIVDYPRFYQDNFTSSTLSTSRFPSFDPKNQTMSVNQLRLKNGTSNVESTEVYVSVLWQAMLDALEDDNKTAQVIIIARSVKIFLRDYLAGAVENEDNTHNVRIAGKMHELLQARDISPENAEKYRVFVNQLHPCNFYHALMNNFDILTCSVMPCIHHLFVGLVTNPRNLTLYGIRSTVLRMAIERAARRLNSVRIKKGQTQDEYYTAIVKNASVILVPILRQWSFVLDCLALFNAPNFMSTPAASIEKQIKAYAEYSRNFIHNLRCAMESVDPAVARLTNIEIIEMLLRAGEATKKTEYHAHELSGSSAEMTTRFSHAQARADAHDTQVVEYASSLVTNMLQGDPVVFNYRTSSDGSTETFFSSTFWHNVVVLVVDFFGFHHDDARYLELWQSLPFESSKRITKVWRYYTGPARQQAYTKCLLVRRLAVQIPDDIVSYHYKNLEAAVAPVGGGLIAQEEEKIPEWRGFLDSVDVGQVAAREKLFSSECCVCLDDTVEFVSCCVYSPKHQVCTKCILDVVSVGTCPLCRHMCV